MTRKITAADLDNLIKENSLIEQEIRQNVLRFSANFPASGGFSSYFRPFGILKEHGLLLIPIEDKEWSGSIFRKEEKMIPVINSFLPRVNQLFEAWHEVFHLVYGNILADREEDRKADLFASKMLLSGVFDYFSGLNNEEFLPRVFRCMEAFQAPYKAVLIALYESATRTGNSFLAGTVKTFFDIQFNDFPAIFREQGLDDFMVMPSFTVNFDPLLNRISEQEQREKLLLLIRELQLLK